MNIKGRKFTDLTTGKTYTVVNVFDTVAILDNKTKINISKLLDTNSFSSVGGGNQIINESAQSPNYADQNQIDPSKFMGSNWVSNISETVKRLDVNNISDNPSGGVVVKSDLRAGPDPNGEKRTPFAQKEVSHFPTAPNRNESAVSSSADDPEFEKQELLRKYQNQQRQANPADAVRRQKESMARYLDEGEEVEMQKVAPKVRIVQEQLVNDPIEIKPSVTFSSPENESIRVVVETPKQEKIIKDQPTQEVEQEDPIVVMFNKAKRNVEFKFNIEIKEFIPKPDFISLMEDSYEKSIIDFLAEEFTNKILNDPKKIKERIKEEINRMIKKIDDEE